MPPRDLSPRRTLVSPSHPPAPPHPTSSRRRDRPITLIAESHSITVSPSFPLPSPSLAMSPVLGLATASPSHHAQLGDSPTSVKMSPTRHSIRRWARAWFRTFRLPLKFIIIASLSFFTLLPALLIWFLSWDAGNEGINGMEHFGVSSVEDVAAQLRSSLIVSTEYALLKLVQPAEQTLLFTTQRLKADDNLSPYVRTAAPAFPDFWDSMHEMFHMVATATVISEMAFSFFSDAEPSLVGGTHSAVSQFGTFTVLNYDLVSGNFQRTIYQAQGVLNEPFHNDTIISYFVLNQALGDIVFPIVTFAQGGLQRVPINITLPEYVLYVPHLTFHSITGVPQIILDFQVPYANYTAAYEVSVATSVYAVSAFLRSLLNSTKERLFVNFRNEFGSLLGASHGKYFSHSDFDYRMNNPLLNPPPVSEFKVFTPLESTDDTIRIAAEWMMSRYFSWAQLPDLNTIERFFGEDYWVISSMVESPCLLRVNLVLLVDRASKMGPIEQHKKEALDSVASTNHRLTVILTVIVCLVFAFAVVVSIFLARSLDSLASGMDSLALLRFEERAATRSHSIIYAQSHFSEVSKCERSFFALERGIKAFVKYVPKDIVQVMLNGEMATDNVMMRKVLTVMFADVAGFSSICEKVTPEQLVQLTADYFQSMCDVVNRTRGALDKFIGDCIMAIWNAPQDVDGHEVAAVRASLEMQFRVFQMWDEWKHDGLPQLRFRVGINTDTVLVGNLGCDYRINYTCLGDGVNLASRLESINKQFDSVVMISTSTYTPAAPHFAFRKMGNVTVPGKEEIVGIFEPLFAIDGDEDEELGLSIRSPFGSGSGAPALLGLPPPSVESNLENAASLNPLTGLKPVGVSSRVTLSSGGEEPGLPDGTFNPPPSNDSVLFHWRWTYKLDLCQLVYPFDKGVELLINGNVTEAHAQFQQALQFVPHDGSAKFFLGLSGGPSENSDNILRNGVLHFDHK